MINQAPHYCKLLHEVPKPLVDSSLRKLHYSIYEASYLPSKPGLSKSQSRFALLWDEDHDIRVFSVIEALANLGLLPYVAVIGERKAAVTIVLNSHITEIMSEVNYISRGFSSEVSLIDYSEAIKVKVRLDTEDEWFPKFYIDYSFISYSHRKENEILSKYLDMLDNLWDLSLLRLSRV